MPNALWGTGDRPCAIPWPFDVPACGSRRNKPVVAGPVVRGGTRPVFEPNHYSLLEGKVAALLQEEGAVVPRLRLAVVPDMVTVIPAAQNRVAGTFRVRSGSM